ncbi:MAG: hybrid sensor histidine kinase/response regulator [Deltaproteobacteria bacterium]|nr:hybrid sensor histidine kinase/response regulator [Deltaproteobacteria bacterium]
MAKKGEFHTIEGMAHNLNNLISIILAQAQLLRKRVTAESPLGPELQAIEQAAKEATQMAHKLQTFQENAALKVYEWIYLNDLLSEVVEMTRSVWQYQAKRKGVTIHVSLQLGEVPKVKVQVLALKEVFINFILNAVDAISEKKDGMIEIKTELRGECVQVSISDSGIGMTSETLSKVFNPYFSTKGKKGRGLGLSSSRHIIQEHKGALMVESTPAIGTTFAIQLPIEKQDAAFVERKKIMLVDDEKDYRKATAELLSLEGFDVEQASDGKEAIHKIQEKNFDVILTDLHMPGISGSDLVKYIKNQEVSTKIILISGVNEKLSEEELKSLNVDACLVKPCLIEDIAKAIRNTCH